MPDVIKEEKTLKEDNKRGKRREEVSGGGAEDGLVVAYTLFDPLAFSLPFFFAFFLFSQPH